MLRTAAPPAGRGQRAGCAVEFGTNTPAAGDSAPFIIRLEPGEFKLAASHDADAAGSAEHMALAPLTVTDAAASPAASAEPPATAPQIVQEFNAMIPATPATGVPVFARFV
ncbi:MAG TPA: hypothetical protein VFI22_10040 [Thermomicrobiales bacterium]|nr:hypothetical protein [Thermomicrobiales bacterium]